MRRHVDSISKLFGALPLDAVAGFKRWGVHSRYLDPQRVADAIIAALPGRGTKP